METLCPWNTLTLSCMEQGHVKEIELTSLFCTFPIENDSKVIVLLRDTEREDEKVGLDYRHTHVHKLANGLLRWNDNSLSFSDWKDLIHEILELYANLLLQIN